MLLASYYNGTCFPIGNKGDRILLLSDLVSCPLTS